MKKDFVFTFYFYSGNAVSICIEANNLYSALQKLYENCGSLFSNKNENCNSLFSNKSIRNMDIKVNGKRILKRRAK